jgi:hypothetical protein
MSHKASSPRTPDLFEVTLTIPTPASEPVPVAARPPMPASLSDAQLAEQLGQLVAEVQRRLEKSNGSRPGLAEAVHKVRSSLDRLAPGATNRSTPSRSSQSASVLQEGQRKAVRAALHAGVAPTQVAKHFGLPLATIRKVLADPS